MWKLASSTLGICALSALLVVPALAQDNSENAPEMGMMGGDCPMMRMMGGGMGHGMMGGGMMGQGMGKGQMGQGMMRGHGMGMMRGARMGAMVEARLAYLKFELGITDAQKDAWAAYADAVRARVANMQGVHQAMMETMQTGNALNRMDARIKGMETMLSSLKEVKPAAEKLYASLSDDQKKVADQLIGRACGAM
ncbi:conserved exported protein of unknown function [Candidatus Filomicrobium marinum]|uniref:LTXXQ motif family protein n=1 Tax=Candidatus Filomicrobium marinum TaxID=1608628 RepID=A0A0D6JHR9_9HYPH|nr:Spy/CpxP family protein refolding chaperone [Candidatus Filomicrobium marinum]CFX46566.1 conserved exported protein of unknown function [Candidatus Filomicrobium marinum]CPR20641.1 conserved exported protein of unknown function [Candidatus Filomicrobium marinum]